MGRITIFTTSNCLHCKRVKAALHERDLPFHEINLSLHPERRVDMISLSDFMSVPQVFFNSLHMGGAEETMQVLESEWPLTLDKAALLEKFHQEIASQTDPQDKRLAMVGLFRRRRGSSTAVEYVDASTMPEAAAAAKVMVVGDDDDNADDNADNDKEPQHETSATPTSPWRHKKKNQVQQKQEDEEEEDEEDATLVLPGRKTLSLPDHMATVSEMTRFLLQTMPAHDISHRTKTLFHCFTGKEGVDVLMKTLEIDSRDKTLYLASELIRQELIHFVATVSNKEEEEAEAEAEEAEDEATRAKKKKQPYQDSSCYLYRLQPYQTPHVLNSFRVWADPVPSDPFHVLEKLRRLLDEVQSQATTRTRTTTEEGETTTTATKVDYLAAVETWEYQRFENAVCELQTVRSFDSMNDNGKLAFGINLYNLMVQYAHLKVGIPLATSVTQRLAFFHQVKMNVGGEILSLSELEHGILRGNARPPYSLTVPFHRQRRRRLCLEGPVDPRVHFALHCGAQSCPARRAYTSSAAAASVIREELRIAATAFCESEQHVQLDEEKAEVRLSAIFNWYRNDFVAAGSNSAAAAAAAATPPEAAVVICDPGVLLGGGGGADVDDDDDEKAVDAQTQSSAKSAGTTANNNRNQALLWHLLDYLRGDRREILQHMLARGRVRIKYLPYDWTTPPTVSRHKTFSASNLVVADKLGGLKNLWRQSFRGSHSAAAAAVAEEEEEAAASDGLDGLAAPVVAV